MADIDKITASNGTTYNIKDATARDSISRVAFSHATEIKIQPSTTADNLVIAVTTDDDRELKFAMTATELRYYVNGTLKWTK